MKKERFVKIYLAIFSIFVGCSSNVCFRDHIFEGKTQEIIPSHKDYANTVQVKYYGAGGFLIRKAGVAILLAPFFSNRSVSKLLVQKLESDTTTIDEQFESLRIDGVEGILVGHAHYDHLMDVPYITRKYFLSQKKPIQIYGSQTMKNLISNSRNPKGIPDDNLVAVVGDSVSTSTHMSDYIYVGSAKRIRFRAIESMHAPHIGKFKLFCGEIPEPIETMPKWVAGWKEGQTLAYIIDFLDEHQNPIFRIHYQDAASDSCVSMPNDELLKDKAVDLSILCVASFKNVTDYPVAMLRKLKPKYAILAHWENFFTAI